MKRSKKGFTLVELCVVIGITAIIVVLCCTFIISYNGSVNKVKAYKDYMNEISVAKMAVTNWINAHDSAYYSITEVPTTKGLSAAYKDDAAKNGSVSFLNGVLACAGNNVSSTAFSIVNKIEFRIDGALLLCTVGADGQEDVPLAFPLFSKTERNRYASDEKIDLTKLASVIDEWITYYLDNVLAPNIRVIEGHLEAGLSGSADSAFNGKLKYEYDTVKKYGNLVWQKGLNINTNTSYVLGSVNRITFKIVERDGNKVIQYTLHYDTGDGNDYSRTYEITNEEYNASKWNNKLIVSG